MGTINKQLLDREFIRWFYEDAYPTDLTNRAMIMQRTPQLNVEQRDYWMRWAFKAGAEAMWQDINGALMDWACAVEGLDPELLAPAEVYDRARDNLHTYIYHQLELFH